MFENIIAQDASLQLCDDIKSNNLAPSMLFFGPPSSGKGSAALELARILSCEKSADWNCSCPSCIRHRYLLHNDLLIAGPRAFSAEIAASAAAFLREPSVPSVKLLFIRSLRKLTARFSPVLWEDDSKFGKFAGHLQSIEEGIAELENPSSSADPEKTSAALLKTAFKLESEGISDNIPINQIRKASYWSRLAPSGKQKTLILENAGLMQEGSRNSLLKILEEPPPTVNIILTAGRKEDILPTLLSRLRPYRFIKRSEEKELEVIRRVFRDTAGENTRAGLSFYLDSFLPQSNEKLHNLAAFFITSIARQSALALKKNGINEILPELNALGEYCAPIAEKAGYGKVSSAGEVIPLILAESENFQARSFSRFIKLCLDTVSFVQRKAGVYPQSIWNYGIWRKYAGGADAAVSVWKQSPALSLENFFYRMIESFSNSERRMELSGVSLNE